MATSILELTCQIQLESYRQQTFLPTYAIKQKDTCYKTSNRAVCDPADRETYTPPYVNLKDH
jgi:hypothetical protein